MGGGCAGTGCTWSASPLPLADHSWLNTLYRPPFVSPLPGGRTYQEELANNPEGNQSEGPEALRPLVDYDPAQGDALEVGSANRRLGRHAHRGGMPAASFWGCSSQGKHGRRQEEEGAAGGRWRLMTAACGLPCRPSLLGCTPAYPTRGARQESRAAAVVPAAAEAGPRAAERRHAQEHATQRMLSSMPFCRYTTYHPSQVFFD